MRLSCTLCLSRVRVACLGALIFVHAVLPGAGCQTSLPPAPQPSVTDVTIQNRAFSPSQVTIKKGESVRWTNQDAVLHTATSGNPGDADAGGIFDTMDLPAGTSDTIQFNDTGEFVYFCRHHPTLMIGAQVKVTD